LENKIVCKGCLNLISELPDNHVDLVITSPPYNVGKDYEIGLWKNDEEYLQFIFQVLRDLYRVLKPGRFICWNISHRPHKNTPVFHAYYMEQIGYRFQETIIWQKPDAISPRFGTTYKFPYPFYYYPNNVYEQILVYQKPGEFNRRKTEDLKLDPEWLKSKRSDIWEMRTVRTHKEHPASFPLELPKRLIQLYSYPGEIVFDPFCEIGTALIAAKALKRKYLRCDTEEEYIKTGKRGLS